MQYASNSVLTLKGECTELPKPWGGRDLCHQGVHLPAPLLHHRWAGQPACVEEPAEDGQ